MLRLHSFGPADGRPVLALHGLKGHGRRFRRLATEQLPHLRVHAPDLRGHGGSPVDPPWTLERHVADIVATLDTLGLNRLAVIGHSLGATVAVHLARRAPHRVSRLVLLDPGIGMPDGLARAKTGDALDAPAFDDPRDAARERAAFWPATAAHLVPDEIADHLAQGPDGRWRWRYLPEMAAATYDELVRPALTPPPGTPTLLVVAARGVVGPEYVDACRAALGAELTRVELDCGHHVHLERPAWTGALIRDFLA
ncbi:alpha/beta fold hydrolase [Rugosimonospora africana]|uniref:Putative hydrolase, alpha/beta fold LipV n=1 Tax=Rugosimonospora africana TaxID=556532 RepID=A0A8J3VT73_9ACTN|nr:alpha/beta hydrolase [Rugosimonospora africana]GIH17905.1 putative hydrolase, alpha/beta fold LipV [Rugosimonospora africana]